VPKIIDPVFTKTSQNARFLLSENERFGLVFVKTGSINSGTGQVQYCISTISLHGQNLSSTSGEPEFFAQKFFEIPASAVSTVLVTAAHGPNNYKDTKPKM
jgi:hypothetical protein